MRHVWRAVLTPSYISTLSKNVGEKLVELGMAGMWGRQDAWEEALGRTYTEIDGLQVEDLVLTGWRIVCSYSRDAGGVVSKFLQGLRGGRILASRCGGCGRTLLPPRSFCEWCFKDVDTVVELTGDGEVATYSLSYIGTDPRERLPEPKVVAVIWFEDTKVIHPSTRSVVHAAGILHMVGDVKPADVHIGMKVKPVWKPPEQRVGSILDILHFKPRGDYQR